MEKKRGKENEIEKQSYKIQGPNKAEGNIQEKIKEDCNLNNKHITQLHSIIYQKYWAAKYSSHGSSYQPKNDNTIICTNNNPTWYQTIKEWQN